MTARSDNVTQEQCDAAREMCRARQGGLARWIIALLAPIALAIAGWTMAQSLAQSRTLGAYDERLKANDRAIAEQEIRANRQFDQILREIRELRNDIKRSSVQP